MCLMIRKTKFKNITIINNLIIPQDIAKLRTYIDCSPLQKEENNPNTFINVQDSECNSILSKAQQLLKSNIEEDFDTLVSDEGIGTVVKFSIGWELPYHCDQWSNLPTYGGAPKRDISSIIYLSDDFKGGELVFPDLGIFIQPVAGSAIYFAGTEEYMHQVTPLLSGTRLTCTGFWGNLSGYDDVSIP
jgi:hypothetical protein